MAALKDWPAYFPEDLRRAGRSLALPAGRRVFRTGEQARHLFHLLEGEVRLFRLTPSGDEALLQRALPGDFFATAALALAAYPCEAVCTLPSRLQALPLDAFRAALRRPGRFAEHWVREMSLRQLSLCAACERLHLKGARERILHYLATEGRGSPPRVRLTAPLKVWAQELGLVPETLYRTLRALEREGVVVKQGNTLGLAG